MVMLLTAHYPTISLNTPIKPDASTLVKWRIGQTVGIRVIPRQKTRLILCNDICNADRAEWRQTNKKKMGKHEDGDKGSGAKRQM